MFGDCAGADTSSISEDVGMLSGKQPNHHLKVEARKCLKCSREMQKL